MKAEADTCEVIISVLEWAIRSSQIHLEIKNSVLHIA